DPAGDAVVMWLERGRKALVPAEVVQVQAKLLFEKGQLRAEPEAAGSYARMLRLAGSLRLYDRRMQSSSCRTSFAEQRTGQSLAAAIPRPRPQTANRERAGVDAVHAGREDLRPPPPDRLDQLNHSVARGGPTRARRLSPGEERAQAPAAAREEVRRLHLALARPLEQQRQAVWRRDDSSPPAGRRRSRERQWPPPASRVPEEP